MFGAGRATRFSLVAAMLATSGCGRFAFEPDGQPDGGPMCERVFPEPFVDPRPSRYVAPTGGSDTNPGTVAQPWATIAHALTAAAPDEAIVLLDGVYAEMLYVHTENRIIRAMSDGGAIFDGGDQVIPCDFAGDNLSITGVHCRRGRPTTVNVAASKGVMLSRVTAHTAISGTVFRVQQSMDTVLEDVAAWGPASNDYLVIGSSRTVIRRCWGRWEDSDDFYNAMLVLSDDSTDSLVENCVLTSNVPYEPTRSVVGINVFSSDQIVDRNHFYGNVVYTLPDWGATTMTEVTRTEGTRFIDTALIDNGGGMFQRTDADFGIQRMTSVGNETAFLLDAHSTEPKNGDFAIAGYVRDSVLGRATSGFNVARPDYITMFEHTNNTLFEVATPYAGSITADASESIGSPSYDVERYGRGAYLMQGVPGRGAEVLYRYQARVLFADPLWPWPLESRLVREAGQSVTWESGGGLWKVLPDALAEPSGCP